MQKERLNQLSLALLHWNIATCVVRLEHYYTSNIKS